LDLEAMRGAGALLVGQRDFGKLSNNREKTDTVRRLDAVRIEVAQRILGGGSPSSVVDLVFEGDAFLYKQVRIMAALLLEVGEGKRSLEGVAELLTKGDRQGAPGALGPHGLCLVEVFYGEDSGRPREQGEGGRPGGTKERR
jgi:tRNA pseudouridine38-40 synthase